MSGTFTTNSSNVWNFSSVRKPDFYRTPTPSGIWRPTRTFIRHAKKNDRGVHYTRQFPSNRLQVLNQIKEYNGLLEDLNDLAVIAERANEPTIPHEQIVKELKADGYPRICAPAEQIAGFVQEPIGPGHKSADF